MVNVNFPGPSVGGNTETHCRIANVVMGALAPGLKERSAATDGASHSNFLFGGTDAKTGEFFCCYDLTPVGWGGRSFADGNDAVGGINGNCPHIPVEVFEFRFPWHVEEFKLVDGSGGPGKFRGGLALSKTVRCTDTPMTFSYMSDRQKVSPWGIHGGHPGAKAELFMKRNGSDEWLTITQAFNKVSPSKFANVPIAPGRPDQDLLAGGRRLGTARGARSSPGEGRSSRRLHYARASAIRLRTEGLARPAAFAPSSDLKAEAAMTVIPNSIHARDVAYLLHPNTNARRHEKTGPIVIDRGEGIYVYDDQGKQYIEAMAGLWSVGVGFGEQRLVDAATRQMAKLPYYHSFSGKSSEPTIELAERLVKMSPKGLDRVFFTNSGSEANDSVIKLVWFYNNAIGRPEKKKFIARTGGYHGITIASGSLTGLPDQSSRLRPAADFRQACDDAASLSLCRGRRERGGLRRPSCGRARGQDPGRKDRRRWRPSSASL